MSARKNVNQSRPRALACDGALAVAGAVCFNVARDGSPTSARRSSRPPSNSSASVDSPPPPAPSGNYGVGVWPNAPRTRPPSLLGYPPPSTRRKEYRSVLAGTQICEVGYFEKCCEFRKQRAPWNKVPKLRNLCAAKLQQRLFCAVSCQPADAQLEPAESVGMRAVHFRSRIPAMALT
jgi:hypothetical protein